MILGSGAATGTGAVNILDYGGSGNGTTDNLAAFARAIAAQAAVYFPKGTFYFSDSIVLDTVGKSIYGLSRRDTILKFDANTPGIIIGNNSGGSGYHTVDNIAITFNNGFSPTSGQAAITQKNMYRSTLSNITISYAYHGVYQDPSATNLCSQNLIMNIDVYWFNGFGFHGKATGGGNSGNVWLNLYTTNGGSSVGTYDHTTTVIPYAIGTTSETTMIQCNAEWCNTSQCWNIVDSTALVLQSCHIEGVTATSGNTLLNMDNSQVTLLDCKLYNSAVPSNGGVFKLTGGSRLSLIGGSESLVTGFTNYFVSNSAANDFIVIDGYEFGYSIGTIVANLDGSPKIVFNRDKGNFSYGGLRNTSTSLLLEASTATKAALRFRTGALLTTPTTGVMEFDGTNLYITIGGARKTITVT